MVWENIQEYNEYFNRKSQLIKQGPIKHRNCTQWVCLILFVLIFVATFGGGGYFIYQTQHSMVNLLSLTQNNIGNTGFGYVMFKYTGIIVGMVVLSCGLSIVVVLMGKNFAKITMYFLIVFTFFMNVVLIFITFTIGSIGIGITLCVFLLVHAIILYCLWQYINIGIKLLACVARFFEQKPAVYGITFICLLLNIGFTIFWIFSWLGIQSSSTFYENRAVKILTVFWHVDAIFWGFFLYYSMVFFIASACAHWYYQTQDNGILKGINNIKYHLGSICFASILITFIIILRLMVQAKKSDGPVRLLASFAECLIRYIEDYIRILNRNSIIVMSVTSEGYIDSAKTGVSLIFDNLAVFIALDYFSSFYDIFSAVFIGIVPALIGGGIIFNTQVLIDPALANDLATWGSITIIFLSILVSSGLVGLLNQVLNCIYIFYCLDKKFKDMGIQVKNIPPEIVQIFGQQQKNQTAHQASIQYLNNYQN